MRMVGLCLAVIGVAACGANVMQELMPAEDEPAIDAGPPPLPIGCADCAAACILPAECAEGALMCGRHCAGGMAADACPDGMHAVLCADHVAREDCIRIDAPMCTPDPPRVVAACCADDGLAVQECWSDHSCPQPREKCLAAFCQLGTCLIEAVPDGYGCDGGACLNGFCSPE